MVGRGRVERGRAEGACGDALGWPMAGVEERWRRKVEVDGGGDRIEKLRAVQKKHSCVEMVSRTPRLVRRRRPCGARKLYYREVRGRWNACDLGAQVDASHTDRCSSPMLACKWRQWGLLQNQNATVFRCSSQSVSAGPLVGRARKARDWSLWRNTGCASTPEWSGLGLSWRERDLAVHGTHMLARDISTCQQ